jgi:hypothetical protein
MKLSKLLTICASLLIFTPTVVQAEMNLQTDNSRISINSQGRMTLSTKKAPNNYSRADFWSRFRNRRTTSKPNHLTPNCSNRQSTTIVGSNRHVRQTNRSYCK